MRLFYDNQYLDKYFKKRKSLLIIYSIIAFIAVASVVGIIFYYSNLPFMTELRYPLMVAMIVIIFLFTMYSFIFFSITFGRINKYCDYLSYACRGNSETTQVTVLDIYNQTIDYSGNDFFRLNVLIWSELENNFVERIIYVDNEFTLDNVSVGDVITVKIKSSCLLGYEVNKIKEI